METLIKLTGPHTQKKTGKQEPSQLMEPRRESEGDEKRELGVTND